MLDKLFEELLAWQLACHDSSVIHYDLYGSYLVIGFAVGLYDRNL